MDEVKGIYWIEVIRRKTNTINDIEVLESYPFPDVPFEPFGFDLLKFKEQIDLIEDPITRLANSTRFDFIINMWHPNQFIRVTRNKWKYKK